MMKLVNISLYFWHGFKGHDRKGSKGSRKNVIEAPRQSDQCVDAYSCSEGMERTLEGICNLTHKSLDAGLQD